MPRSKRDSSLLSDTYTQQNSELTDAGPAIWKFRLYIAGDSPHSKLAEANLEALCHQFLKGQCQVEIIDLIRDPHRYLKDEILVTPTVVRYEPVPVCVLIGNLSNRQEVLMALGLKER